MTFERGKVLIISLWFFGLSQTLGAQPTSVEIRLNSPVLSVAWSADGKLVASGCESGQIQITDPLTGKEKLSIEVGAPVNGIVFSADGKILGVKSGGVGGPLSVWDIDTKKKLRQLAFMGYSCVHIAFTEDGTTLLASGPGENMVWNHTKGGGSGSRTGKIDPQTVAGVAPNGSFTAWCSPQGAMQMFFHADRKFQQMKIGINPRALAFSPDGRQLIVGHEDKTLRLWEVSGQEIRKFEGLREPATLLQVSRNGKMLAASSTGDPVVRIWDLGTGQLRRRLTTNPGEVRTLALAPDGRTIALATGNFVYLWNVGTRDLGDLGAPKELTLAELNQAWSELADPNPAKSEAAFKQMAQAQHHSVDFLKDQLRSIAVPTVDWKMVEQNMYHLESSTYAVRQRANNELAKLGETIRPALEKFLATKPSLEGERRVNKLLDAIREPGLTPDRLRCLEAIEILERLKIPAARLVLEDLSRDALLDQIRRAAREAVDRLNRPEGKTKGERSGVSPPVN